MHTQCRNLTIAFLLLLAGCTTPYSTPQITGACSRAVGIAEALAREPATGADVILIHGMCTHDREWVAAANNSLLRMLGSDVSVDPSRLEPSRIFTQTQLYSQQFAINGKQLRTHAIVWSGAVTPQKKALCYDRGDKRPEFCAAAPAYPYTRAQLNNALKSNLLDDCLVDAMIYAGSTGAEIRRQVADAITYAAGSRAADTSSYSILRQAETEQAPLFMISESLGSKILFDSLYMMYRDNKSRVVRQTLGRTVQIFMAANQLPLLSLANGTEASVLAAEQKELKKAPDVGPGTDSLRLLLRQLQKNDTKSMLPKFQTQVPPGPRQIVAFSDPNDLLSYTLMNSSLAKNPQYHIIDVLVSNDSTWFGYVENPLAAHTKYLDNQAVSRIIVHGIPKMPGCEPG